tara:strand:+ start:590 stop:1099 length:510 start_codon:yes stop_codon:yes gene_type:complete
MNSIFLIGFMGAGKSTIGLELSKKLSFNLVDTDKSIERSQGMKITEIFSKKGEDFFRELETKELKLLSSENNLIVSTGGGIILKDSNREILNNVFSIYLKADFDIIFERIKEDETRPLLLTDNPYKTAKEIFESRYELYESFQNKINTDNKHPKDISDEIVSLYKNYEN